MTIIGSIYYKGCGVHAQGSALLSGIGLAFLGYVTAVMSFLELYLGIAITIINRSTLVKNQFRFLQLGIITILKLVIN